MKTILLSSDNCDDFVNLRGNDLLELLTTVENLMIEYRETLGLSDKITFGIEIEYEGVLKTIVSDYIEKHLDNWISKRDGSLDSGGEVNSPILIDKKQAWNEVKMICEFLKKKRAITNSKAGGHIHTGVQTLGNNVDAWRVFAKLYMLYESVMLRFFFGDKLNGRPSQAQYAAPVAPRIYEFLEKINRAHIPADVINALSSSKYTAIYFGHVHGSNFDYVQDRNTIELRCPNATVEEIIWQNNINAIAKMEDSCKKQLIDEDFLDYKIKSFDLERAKISHSQVQLKEALEYVDLIFDNNLDKMYFLRQYIKSFQPGDNASIAVAAKPFFK